MYILNFKELITSIYKMFKVQKVEDYKNNQITLKFTS